jgi:hypothetical protein
MAPTGVLPCKKKSGDLDHGFYLVGSDGEIDQLEKVTYDYYCEEIWENKEDYQESSSDIDYEKHINSKDCIELSRFSDKYIEDSILLYVAANGDKYKFKNIMEGK